MRVIICGGGQVGSSVAAYLAQENNDVTVIDTNPDLIEHLNDTLDVKGMVGDASNPDVLSAAGASGCDMLLALTHRDEVNMVTCQIAYSLFSVPKKLARIRNQAYLQPQWSNLFSRAHMPIDIIISPEQEVAHNIYQRLAIPGTTYVSSLYHEQAHLIGIVCTEACPLLRTQLKQIYELFPDLDFKIMSIHRGDEVMICDMDDKIEVDDEVFLLVRYNHIQRVMMAFGRQDTEARRLVIAGGGNIGTGLVRMLTKNNPGIRVKIIERSEERARYLSEHFPELIVIQANALDREIMKEVAIGDAEAFIAVTNDDESNILGSLLAKKRGCKRSVTLVNNDIYTSLVGPLGIDTLVSPRDTVLATIMKNIRRGRIRGLHAMRNGFAELIEVEITEQSDIASHKVGDVDIPGEVMVAGLLRDDELIIPDAQTVIQVKDTVMILAVHKQIAHVERICSVHVDLF